MQDYRNLKVWEVSHKLTLKVYTITANFPKSEIYALTSQIRRSSSSIAINIAEGCGRGSDTDFARFLQMSMGSACETEYLIILCTELGYIEDSRELLDNVSEIKRMLSTFINKLKFKANS